MWKKYTYPVMKVSLWQPKLNLIIPSQSASLYADVTYTHTFTVLLIVIYLEFCESDCEPVVASPKLWLCSFEDEQDSQWEKTYPFTLTSKLLRLITTPACYWVSTLWTTVLMGVLQLSNVSHGLIMLLLLNISPISLISATDEEGAAAWVVHLECYTGDGALRELADSDLAHHQATLRTPTGLPLP